MQPIQAVLFDLDGTLLHTEPSSIEMFYQSASSNGIELTSEQRLLGRRWAHWYWAESADLHADLALFGGSHESAEFWSRHAWRHLTSMGVEDEQARQLGPVITQELRQQGQPQEFVPQDARAALEALQSRGLRLGLVSNRRQPLFEVAERMAMQQHFHLLLAAGEVGAWKPDPGLLHAAAERLAIQPAKSIYVGDNYFADVLAAEAAGMLPILYDPDGLFPEAECAVISRFDQVVEYVADQQAAF
jgi:phosphoglycolate phosphatase